MARKDRIDRGIVPYVLSTGQRVFYVRLYHNGRRRQFGSFPTRTEARAFYEQAKAQQRARRFFPEAFQKGHGLTLAESIESRPSSGDDERYAKFWTAKFGMTRLRDLTAAQIERVQRELATDKQPQTVLHYLKFLRKVLNLEVRDGHLDANPVNSLTLPTVPRGRLRFLSFAEWGKLKKMLGAHWPVVRFAIITGLRQAEQFSRTWADVDLKAGRLTLLETKAGTIQYLNLSREAVGLLAGWKRTARSNWIHPSENPDTPIDPNNFIRRVFKPALTAAKLDPITWHGLRHTGASWLAMSGASERDIAAYLRHASTSLVGRYAHLSPAYQQGLMERVSGFGTATYTAAPTKQRQAKRSVTR